VGLAILQLFIWAAVAIGGYVAGEHIAELINPDYINYVSLIIEMIKNSAGAFSTGAFVIAVIMVVAGFLMYSVLASMVAAIVDKMEDISSAMAVFQIPVIIGFLAAYFIPMTGSDALYNIAIYLPITSPFCVPAEILLGNMNIPEGVFSLLILMASAFVLMLITAKLYRDKLFNRH
jgi:ABC-type Na+ efflux pump permease subunit